MYFILFNPEMVSLLIIIKFKQHLVIDCISALLQRSQITGTVKILKNRLFKLKLQLFHIHLVMC